MKPIALAGLIAFAAHAADPGAPPAPEVLSSRDMGLLETSPIIALRDGAFSTRVGAASVWVYGDTGLTTPGVDGGTWRHNTLSWTHDLDAFDALTGFADWADASGAPVTFLPLTQDEIATNALHQGDNCQVAPCNYEFGLWPGMPLFDPEHERVLYPYMKLWLGPGAWNFTGVGTGIAVGPAMPGGSIVRPIVDPQSSDPTLLFYEGEPFYVNASVKVRESGTTWVYLYDCSGGDGFTKPMHVARVPIDAILDRSQWRFYAAGGVWSQLATDAIEIFDGSDQLSVHWSDFLGRYVAMYLQPLSQNAVARVADRPEGPWSDPTLMFVALPPVRNGWVYSGTAHGELALDGGRLEYFTYVRDTGPLAQERRIVEVEFKNRVETGDRDADFDPVDGVMLSDVDYPGQICMGMDQHQGRQAAVQFRLGVPHPATITSATVQLVSSGHNQGTYTGTVRAIAQDDVAPFVGGASGSFTATYPMTAAGAAWTPEDAAAGATVTTPELRALVQEVVDRPGWTAGHHLGLVFPEMSVKQKIRCFDDLSAGTGTAAILRLGWYANGTPVCLDARGGEDALRVAREPAGGCGSAGGPSMEFVFGRIGALRASGGAVDLGPVRCADASSTGALVRAADPDQPVGDGSFYLVRASGSPDFGRALLSDGSTPSRIPAASACP
ncbi:MAG TPA: DUF4185 domain-containing protein [Candidatus Polarisedimenticolaceae bacterium]|nr:DUF4185 domain-containing protein [Candidatus Polarisedimenticolaceae bacterium]